MREIKFRVWCEFEIDGVQHKEMAGPENWFLLTQTGKLYAHGPMRPLDTRIADKHTKLIPMLYTGLCDKSGKEIYEGDIVHFESEGEQIIVDDGFCDDTVVVFMNGEFRFKKNSHCYFAHNKDVCEVIDNIHEKPELLEK